MSDPRISDRPLPTAPPPSSLDAPPRSKSSVGWIVATVLFVVIVAGIAWISQFLPRGSTKTTPAPATAARNPDVEFLVRRAVWEQPEAGAPETIPYAREFEPGVEGHYDFPFRNPNDYPIMLGFKHTSCDCSALKATALKPDEAALLPTDASKLPMAEVPGRTWTELPKGGHTGIEVPAKGGGVVRMFWNGRKKPGDYLKLNIYVWTAPLDRLDDQQTPDLQVPIVMTLPVRFDTNRLSLGTLSTGGVAQGVVHIHSATQDKLPIEVDKSQLDELFDVKLETVDGPAMKLLEKRLRLMKIDTRLRSAVRVTVTLREQHGGKQLDQGLFSRALPLRMAGIPDIDLPMVTAITRGEVELGGEEIGRVVFRPFLSREGTARKTPLWTENPADLVVEATSPPFIVAKLTRDKKGSTAGRHKWNLDVTLPPGSLEGTLPEDAVIILRTDTQPPRRIRIPIVATGGRG